MFCRHLVGKLIIRYVWERIIKDGKQLDTRSSDRFDFNIVYSIIKYIRNTIAIKHYNYLRPQNM